MSKLISTILKSSPHDYITDQEISVILGPESTPEAKANLTMRLVKKGELIRLRRGLFILAKEYQRYPINTFEIADLLYHPSYIGLHSALRFHNAIPEAVYSTTCITTNRGKEIATPLGHFSYKYVNKKIFRAGLLRENSRNGSFLISSLEKTILDFLYIYERDWVGLDSLLKDIRLDEEVAEILNTQDLKTLAPIYNSKRISNFASQLIKDIS